MAAMKFLVVTVLRESGYFNGCLYNSQLASSKNADIVSPEKSGNLSDLSLPDTLLCLSHVFKSSAIFNTSDVSPIIAMVPDISLLLNVDKIEYSLDEVSFNIFCTYLTGVKPDFPLFEQEADITKTIIKIDSLKLFTINNLEK